MDKKLRKTAMWNSGLLGVLFLLNAAGAVGIHPIFALISLLAAVLAFRDTRTFYKN